MLQIARKRIAQSVADTAAQITIKTGLVSGLQAWQIKQVDFQLESTFVMTWANADISAKLVLRRGAPDGTLYSPNNKRHIASMDVAQEAQAASSNVYVPVQQTWRPPAGFLVADEEIGLQLVTQGTGAVNVGYVVIFYDIVAISLQERNLACAWRL
ncbi:MAG: hypothetical protein WAW96_13490 [Alphaproteobacteria bacterium]